MEFQKGEHPGPFHPLCWPRRGTFRPETQPSVLGNPPGQFPPPIFLEMEPAGLSGPIFST